MLLATVDAVRQMLAKIEADGNDGERDYADIVAQLAQLCVDEDAAPEVEAAAPTVEAASPAPAHEPPHELPPAPEVDEVIAKEPEAEAAPAPVAELAPEAKKKSRPTRKPKVSQPEPVAAPIEASPAPVEAAAPLPVAHEATPTPSAPVTAAPANPSTPHPETHPREDVHETASAAAESSIRVNVNLLDKLMNLVGELVLVRNQIFQFSIHQQETTFLGTSQRLNLITSE